MSIDVMKNVQWCQNISQIYIATAIFPSSAMNEFRPLLKIEVNFRLEWKFGPIEIPTYCRRIDESISAKSRH